MTASGYGVIFDLDGVLTDTAEFHYLAWQALADDEGIPFDRAANEQLRGVSRRDSLLLMLGEREVDEATLQEMMERKNDLYLRSLQGMSPHDTLPGAIPLVIQAKRRGMKVAIGSSSKNAPFVLDKLGIAGLFDAVADGNSVEQAKPAPDLFLHAAELLALPPARCVVIEDAESGVDAALAAGMTAVGIGPEERVGHAHHRWPTTAAVDLDAIAPIETVEVPGGVRLLDGWVVLDGSCPADPIAIDDGGWSGTVHVPTAMPVACSEVEEGGAGEGGTGASTTDWRHSLDVRYVRHRRRLEAPGAAPRVEDSWFVALDQPNLLVRRQVIEAPTGSTVRCESSIEAAGWFGPSAQVADLTERDEGVWCVDLASDDGARLLLTTGVVRGGTVTNTDAVTEGAARVRFRTDVEVGGDGRVVVERFVSLHASGAVDRAVEGLLGAAHQGYEPLLARHALAWEAVWRAMDIVVDDPVAQTLGRLDRARMVTAAAASGWPEHRDIPALLDAMSRWAETSLAGAGEVPSADERSDYERFIEAAIVNLVVEAGDVPPGEVWTTLVAGFGGIRARGSSIEVEPGRFAGGRSITCRSPLPGGWVEVTSAPGQVGVHVDETTTAPATVTIAGDQVVVAPGETRTVRVADDPQAGT